MLKETMDKEPQIAESEINSRGSDYGHKPGGRSGYGARRDSGYFGSDAGFGGKPKIRRT